MDAYGSTLLAACFLLLALTGVTAVTTGARFTAVKQETIDNRILVTHVSLPEESLVNSQYRLILENSRDETVDIYLCMSYSQGYAFRLNEEDETVA